MFGTRGATWRNVGVTRGNAALHGTSAIFRMDLMGVSERLKATNTVFACVCCIFRGGRLRDHLLSILFPSISLRFGRAKYVEIHMKHHETELPLHLESLSFVFGWKEYERIMDSLFCTLAMTCHDPS